jgi:hypothetical protein
MEKGGSLMKDVRRGERRLASANHSIRKRRRHLRLALARGGQERDAMVALLGDSKKSVVLLRGDLERRRTLDSVALDRSRQGELIDAGSLVRAEIANLAVAA